MTDVSKNHTERFSFVTVEVYLDGGIWTSRAIVHDGMRNELHQSEGGPAETDK